MSNPANALENAFQRIADTPAAPIITNQLLQQQVEYVARNLSNRAGVRLLLSCLLAKVDNPAVDVRKPYTQIGDEDAFSGRTYDERYITPFINLHHLPCNNTTAFLTPALRNRNATLEKGLDLVGRPPQLYTAVLDLLDAVHQQQISAADMLAETIRCLILLRDERQQRIEALLTTLQTTTDAIPLSAEEIVHLVSQHLNQKGTSRLPVLIVAAAYSAAHQHLGTQLLDLQTHNAADYQTGALGDLELTLIEDKHGRVVTSYEMKDKPVTHEDVERALQKLAKTNGRVNNYIFISTANIDADVEEYARSLYAQTGGIEFVILDCISFLRHYLHLFHTLRTIFLEEYQARILAEPESAVSQPLKEAFLAMRQVAEAE